MIRDTAAQNKSLDNDYGATKGANAPASHTFHLFAGDPRIPEADGGGVELTTGYTPPTITNNGASWPAAANGAKTGAVVALTFTADLADGATHWALKGSDGYWWDTGELDSEISAAASGTSKNVVPVIFYEGI